MRRNLSLAIGFAVMCGAVAFLPFAPQPAGAAQKKKAEEWKAPALPDGKDVVTDT